jgi:hypothetical protein
MRSLTTLFRDRNAATIVEFALVSPLFFLALFGVLDYGMQFYGQHILQGAVSQAARNSTLEDYAGNQQALDDMVEARVHQVFASATVEFSRRAYQSFDDVGKPEEIEEKPSSGGVTRVDGRLDPGECFYDANGSGNWEADRARAGNGGADDVVHYEVEAKIKRMFPFWALAGQSQDTTLRAATVLRNQPYGTNSFVVRKICP